MGSASSIPQHLIKSYLELEGQLQEKIAENNNYEIENKKLRKQLETKNYKITTLEQEVNRLKQELKDNNCKIDTLEEDVSSRDTDLKKARVKIRQLGKLVSRQNENVRTLKLELAEATEKPNKGNHKKNSKDCNKKNEKEVGASPGKSSDVNTKHEIIIFNLQESDDHYMDILEVDHFMLQLTGKSIKCRGISRLGEPRDKPRPIKVQLSSASDMETLLAYKAKTQNLNSYKNVNIDEYVPRLAKQANARTTRRRPRRQNNQNNIEFVNIPWPKVYKLW